MKPHPPALTHDAIAVAASKKTLKVRRQLRAAESELHAANELLAEAIAHPGATEVENALERNLAAETQVHQANEELGTVSELLNLDAAADRPASGQAPGSRSGHGVQSVLAHLRQHRGQPQ